MKHKKLQFKVGDRVVVKQSALHPYSKRIGDVYELNIGVAYPIYVRFTNDKYDTAGFDELELEHDKNYIVHKLLSDL